MIPLPHTCNRMPVIYSQYGEWCAYCSNCYDGAPDAGSQDIAWGRKFSEMVEDWNYQVLEALEIDGEPVFAPVPVGRTFAETIDLDTEMTVRRMLGWFLR